MQQRRGRERKGERRERKLHLNAKMTATHSTCFTSLGEKSEFMSAANYVKTHVHNLCAYQHNTLELDGGDFGPMLYTRLEPVGINM